MNRNRCIICGADCVGALHIMGRSVCPQCESRIMTVDAADSQYDDFLARLKAVSKEVAMEQMDDPWDR